MTKSNFSKSIRKYIRKKKAEIRKLITDPNEQKRQIEEFMQDICKRYSSKSKCHREIKLPEIKIN